MATGREWYPAIFAELERTGATAIGLGVREVPDDEPGIRIEFVGADGFGAWVCDLEDAADLLDSISDGEASSFDDFEECWNAYFGDDDQEGDDEQ